MERLSKSKEPSFIFVVRVREDLSVKDTFVLHLGGAVLEQVLKRLALESHKKEEVSNRKTITFTRGDDWRPFGDSERLDAVVENVCREYSDSGDYLVAKAKELREAGYGPNPVTFNFKLQGDSEDEIIEGLMGLNPLKIIEFSGTEERFGFKRPYGLDFAGTGTLSVTPVNSPSCRIFYRQERYGTPLVKDGTVVSPPFMPKSKDKLRLIVKSFPVTLDIRLSGTFKITIADLRQELRSCGWWKDVFRILILLGSKDFSLELYTPDGEKVFGSNLPTSTVFGEEVTTRHAMILETIGRVENLLERVGLSGTEFTLQTIMASDPAVQTCFSLVDEIGTSFEAKLEGMKQPVAQFLDQPKVGIFVDTVMLGDVGIAFAAVSEVIIKEDDAGVSLEGVVARRGFLEASNSMPITTFADIVAKEVGAVYRIVGNGQGSLILP
ncbi:hypothetical protein CN311_08865 [Mesorhizobium sanjuanii]|uniref:Uncharacterized protein n=2 Tax=Mesorhizobium sanjuanii TaxID=2037900 RepID=A0A2A6FID2_9HYPH|nr:hypothetical protein CN311_08865 [Mesorhizobium sanjuanii]